MGNQKAQYLFLNDEIVPYAEAKVHFLTPAMKYGATVYEGIRGYWNEKENQLYLFRLDDHFKRLFQSMEMTWMIPVYSMDEHKQFLLELIHKNQFRQDIHIRIMAFVQSDDGGMTSTGPIGLAMAALPMGRISEKAETGLNCCISSWRRISDSSTPPRIKCAGNYQNSRLAGIQAAQDGYDNVLILNENGKLSEGAGSNVFIIRHGLPVTPSVTNNILEGITRDTIIRLFRDRLELETSERDIDRTELYIAEEAFYTGSASEVVPIISIDKHPVGKGVCGDLSGKIRHIYQSIVRNVDSDYPQWKTKVY